LITLVASPGSAFHLGDIHFKVHLPTSSHLVLPFGLRSNGYTSVLVIYPSAGISSSFVIHSPQASRFPPPSQFGKVDLLLGQVSSFLVPIFFRTALVSAFTGNLQVINKFLLFILLVCAPFGLLLFFGHIF